MTKWFPNLTWPLVQGCFAEPGRSWLSEIHAESKCPTLVQAFRVCKLRLNNAGSLRLASLREKTVNLCAHHLALCSCPVWLNRLLQIEVEEARVEHWAPWNLWKLQKLKLNRMNSLPPALPRASRCKLQTLYPSFRQLVLKHILGRLWSRAPRQMASPLYRCLPWRLPWCPRPATLWCYQEPRLSSLWRSSLHLWTLMRQLARAASFETLSLAYTGGTSSQAAWMQRQTHAPLHPSWSSLTSRLLHSWQLAARQHYQQLIDEFSNYNRNNNQIIVNKIMIVF